MKGKTKHLDRTGELTLTRKERKHIACYNRNAQVQDKKKKRQMDTTFLNKYRPT